MILIIVAFLVGVAVGMFFCIPNFYRFQQALEISEGRYERIAASDLMTALALDESKKRNRELQKLSDQGLFNLGVSVVLPSVATVAQSAHHAAGNRAATHHH